MVLVLLAGLLQDADAPHARLRYGIVSWGEARLTADAYDAHSGGTLDLDVRLDWANELDGRILWQARNDMSAFLLLNVSGAWFSGRLTVADPTPYGDFLYPAGMKISTSGWWVAGELGAGAITRVGEGVAVSYSFSAVFQTIDLNQTRESMEFFSLLFGPRAGVEARPLSWLSFGIDAGIWVGPKDAWVLPLAGLALVIDPEWTIRNFHYHGGGAWTAAATAWVELRPSESVAIRLGYHYRRVDTWAHNSSRFFKEDNFFLQFQGPMIAIEIGY